MLHRRRDITFLQHINRNLDKENYSKLTNLHAKDLLTSQSSSGTSITSTAGKQKKFFQDKTNSRNTDDKDFDILNDDSDNDLDNNEKQKKKSEKEKKRDYLKILIQKLGQLCGKNYPNDEVIMILISIFL